MCKLQVSFLTTFSIFTTASAADDAAAQDKPITKVARNTVMRFIIFISFSARLLWVPFCSTEDNGL